MLSPVVFYVNRCAGKTKSCPINRIYPRWTPIKVGKKLLKDEQENGRHPELECQSLNTHIKAVL